MNHSPRNAEPFWTITAQADRTTVLLYGAIGGGFWEEGVSAKELVAELGRITTPNIDLRLNSPGGSVFDGLAIHAALVAHPARVTTHVDGLAASIASTVALAGEEVLISEGALMMIHNPAAQVAGGAAELRAMADVLDQIRASMRSIYAARTTLSDEELDAALDAETWYGAKDAIAAGFATGISPALAVAASHDLSQFRNPPTQQEAPVPDPEAVPAATHVPPPTAAAPRMPRWADVVIAAHNRHADPTRWSAMQERLITAAAALPPGDGVIDVPGDVADALPVPIRQEIHSWMRGQRPVASLFGLAGLPFREGPSFSWPRLAITPKADLQAKPLDAVYLTNLKIDGVSYTKATIGAQLKAPFQLSWTSPGIVGEVGRLMASGYADRYETLVEDDLVNSVTSPAVPISAWEPGAFADAVLEALEQVSTVTRRPVDCMVASADVVRRVRGLRDTTGRAVYPLVSPANADGTVSQGGVPVVEGVPLTTGYTLPAGTLIVGDTTAYRTFDDGSNFATQQDLANLSDLNVVWGYGAWGMLDETGFAKLSVPAA